MVRIASMDWLAAWKSSECPMDEWFTRVTMKSSPT